MGHDDHDTKKGITGGTRRQIRFGYITPDMEVEPDLLEAFFEGIVRANMVEIASDPDVFPCCVSCGAIRYTKPAVCRASNGQPMLNCQRIIGVTELLRRGYGTCIELAAAQCAIKRVKDQKDCRIIVDYELDSLGNRIPNSYHAMIAFPDGSIEDTAGDVKKLQGGCMGGCPAKR